VQSWLAGQRALSQSLPSGSSQVVFEGEDYLSLYTHPQQVASAIAAAVQHWRGLDRA